MTNLVPKSTAEQSSEKNMAKSTYEDISEVKSIGFGHKAIRYIGQKQPMEVFFQSFWYVMREKRSPGIKTNHSNAS